MNGNILKENTLELQFQTERLNQDFIVKGSSFWFGDNDDAFCDCLTFSFYTNEIYFPECPDMKMCASVEISFPLDKCDLANLEGKTFELKSGYEDEEGAYFTNFYMFEHSVTNENKVRVIKQVGDDILIELSCTVEDIDSVDAIVNALFWSKLDRNSCDYL